MNVVKMDELIAFLEEHLEQHDQGTWWSDRGIWKNAGFPNCTCPTCLPEIDATELVENWRCKTTACVAGWAAIRAGWRPNHVGSDLMRYEPDENNPVVNRLSSAQLTELTDTAHVVRIGREVLELSYDEREFLFYEAQNLREIKTYVDSVREGHSHDFARRIALEMRLGTASEGAA